MDCNTGKRKKFADDLVNAVSELSKKHGLEDVTIHRDANPVMVAVRGCLNSDSEEADKEHIEMVLHISPDLRKAEADSLLGSEVVAGVPQDVFRAFDLSDVVATDSIAKGQPDAPANDCSED